MSDEAKRFVPGIICGPEIEEWTAEVDDLEDIVAVHCSTALLGQLMDHAVRYEHTEVFGLLLGRAVRTPTLRTRTLVLDFLAAERFSSSSLTYVEVSAQELIRLDRAHETSPDKKDLMKVGWFHTHPGHGIFMSSTDKTNHSMYSHPWQVALVLDPVHRTWGFFAGPECKTIREINGGARESLVTSPPREVSAKGVPTGEKQPRTWWFLLILLLAAAQALTVAWGAQLRIQVSELRAVVTKQQKQLDALDSTIRATSQRNAGNDVESEKAPSKSTGEQGKKN